MSTLEGNVNDEPDTRIITQGDADEQIRSYFAPD